MRGMKVSIDAVADVPRRYDVDALARSLGLAIAPAIDYEAELASQAQTIDRYIDVGPDPSRRCKDGERTQHLVRLLGKWYGEGKTKDEALLLARGWNTQNIEPWPTDEKIVSTAESMWEKHLRNHPE